MNYEGKVTKVNLNFLSCVLDQKVTVHLGLFPYKRELPEVGNTMKLTNAHCYPSKNNPTDIMLCRHSFYVGVYSTPFPRNNKFAHIILNHRLGVNDLLEIKRNFNVLKHNFSNITGEQQFKVMMDLLEIVIKNSKTPRNLHKIKTCLNEIILQFKLIAVSDCKFIDLNSNYICDKWFHGVHRPQFKNEYLMGYLTIDATYGLLNIADANYSMFIIVTKSSRDNIEPLIKKLVLIKDYVVITEHYPQRSVQNFHYFLVDFKNIFVIGNDDCNEAPIVRENNTGLESFVYTMHIKVINKGTVQLNSKEEPEVWLQVQADEVNNEICYICIPHQLLKVSTYINENEHYSMHFTGSLKLIRNAEITRISPTNKQFLIEDLDTVFVRNTNVAGYEDIHYYSVQECKQYMRENRGLVSFVGVLDNKYFSDPLDSRTRRTTIGGFNTPGSKTHQLKFFTEDSKDSIKLYINNWERSLTPLGLIPYMKILVKNVLIQGTYLKCTFMTRFEILSYEPPVKFCTANLRVDGGIIPWGQPFHLGLGLHVPLNTIIWGSIWSLTVNSVKLLYPCKCCDLVTTWCGPCEHCGHPEKYFDVFINILTTDAYGSSKLISKSIDFLRILLNLTEKQFEVVKNALKEVGRIEYNKFEEMNFLSKKKYQANLFEESLIEHLKTVSNVGISKFEFKCQKMKNENTKYPDVKRPAWMCLEARKL